MFSHAGGVNHCKSNVIIPPLGYTPSGIIIILSWSLHRACNLNFGDTSEEADVNHKQSLMLSALFFCLVYNGFIFWHISEKFGSLNSLSAAFHVVNKDGVCNVGSASSYLHSAGRCAASDVSTSHLDFVVAKRISGL